MANDLERAREKLGSRSDPAHARFHQAYHKSQKRFYGLRAADLRAVERELFPAREALSRERVLPLIDRLTESDWAEENWLGLMLLARIQPQLGLGDVAYLRKQAGLCEGWAWLDSLAIGVLGPLATRLGGPMYEQVRQWSDDEWMWTRRASILVHIVPARRGMLAHDYAWPTFEERLFERQFFIRKAIGWALRECSKKYPREVADFLLRVRDRASGLTFREGSRNLPDDQKARLGLNSKQR